jgi:hypothetical protein
MNLTDGGQIFKPSLFRVRKPLLSVLDVGISSHLRIKPFTVESKFSDIHARLRYILATVKCKDKRLVSDCKELFYFFGEVVSNQYQS